MDVYTGAILLGSKVAAGYCVYGLATFLYYSIYPPVSSLWPASSLHAKYSRVHSQQSILTDAKYCCCPDMLSCA